MTVEVPAPRAAEPWRRAATVLAVVDAALALALLIAFLTDSALAWRATLAAVNVAVTLILLAVVVVLTRTLQRTVEQARAAERLQRETFDAMDVGVVVYDADDRLVLCNREFRRLYAAIVDRVRPGITFEELLRAGVQAGAVCDVGADTEAWIRERVEQHRLARGASVRRMADGQWRRIVEQRLPDGGLLGFSVDVTDAVEKEQALAQARAQALAATQRLEQAIEALPAGFELYDAEDRLVMHNGLLREMYPRVAHLLDRGLSFVDLVRANHAAGGLRIPGDFEAWLEQRRASRGSRDASTVHQLGDGRWVRVHERRLADGGLVGVRIDVSELMQQRAAAEAATQRLHDALEALPDGFALYDADDRLVVFNRRYREIYAASAAAIRIGATFEEILRHGLARGQYEDAAGQEEAWLAQRLFRHRHPGPPELQQLPGDRWLRVDERVTADGGTAGVRTEVTELVRRGQELQRLNAELDRANARLLELSDTDALTGLANRRRFDRRLGEDWAQAIRHASPLSLLLIDVDHFKRFNDTHGHPAGDDCLRRIAQALRGCARRASDLVARYGGEEFALLLPDTGRAAAQQLAQRCLQAVATLELPHGDSPVASHVTLSIGVASALPSAMEGATSLLRDADAALYRAKREGRSRAVLADTD